MLELRLSGCMRLGFPSELFRTEAGVQAFNYLVLPKPSFRLESPELLRILGCC